MEPNEFSNLFKGLFAKPKKGTSVLPKLPGQRQANLSTPAGPIIAPGTLPTPAVPSITPAPKPKFDFSRFLPKAPTAPVTAPPVTPTPTTAPTTAPPVPVAPTTPTGLTEAEALAKQTAPVAPGAPETAPTTPAVPTVPPETESAVKTAEKAFIESQKLSPEALSTRADLDKLIESTKKAFLNIEGQPIPLGFITGQLQAVENRALGLAEPLEAKLSRLQAKRTAGIAASKFALERADKEAEGVEAPKPITVSPGQTVIDPVTGEEIFKAPAKVTKDEGGFSLSPGEIQFDAEGNVIARGGPKAPSATAEAKAIERLEKKQAEEETQNNVIGIVNNILGDANLSRISGNKIGRILSGASFSGTAGVRAQVSQLKALTSLAGRNALKGSGTISDFEAKMLSDSANALNFAIQSDGQILMSDDEVQQNLKNIRGVILSRQGQDVDVLVIKGGEEISATLNRADIQSLIKDGSIIEYQ